MWLIVLLLGVAPFGELQKAYTGAVEKEDWKTVGGVSAEIAALEDARAVPFLLHELRMTVEEPHRRALFKALAFARFRGVKQFVLGSLGSADPYFRAIALEALARFDADRARKRAVELLEVDDDPRVRRAAISVLIRLKSAEDLVRGGAGLPPYEQGPVVGALRGLDRAALQPLPALCTDPDPEVRLLAMLVLAGRAAPEWGELFKKGGSDADPRVKLVATIGRARLAAGAAAAGRLVRLFRQAKGFTRRWEFFDLVARVGVREKPLLQLLAKAARSGSRSLRPKAAESFGSLAGAGAVPLLKELLALQKPWQVGVGAARGLAATRAVEAIPPLIDGLERTTGRLHQELVSALESLTGQPFGSQAKVWRRWWEERGTGFVVKQTPAALWEEETGAAGDRYAFYGIELHSDAAAFVCDISGSMQGKRIETLKQELRFVIRRFPPKGRFNLVLFNEKVSAWSKKLVPATAQRRKAALDYVAALKAGGATNISDALEAALADPGVDTIVLLTDGAPTAGKLRSTIEIAKWFTHLNRERMILLHVVSIGQPSPNLRTMARLSGGSYVER